MLSRRTFLRSGAAVAAALGGCLDRLPADGGGSDGPGWTVSFDQPVLEAPTVADDTVYVGTGSQGMGARGRGVVAALDAATGEETWRSRTRAPVVSRVRPDSGGVYAVTGTGNGFHGEDQRLIKLVDGEQAWETPGVGLYLHLLAVGADGAYLGLSDDAIGASGHEVFSVAPDGSERWRVEGGDTWSGALADGTLLTEQGPTTAALDPASGTERWRVEGQGPGHRPLVVGDTAYLGGTSLRAVAVDSGEERWSFAAEPVNDSVNFVVGGAVVHDGAVYASGYGGALYALEAASGEERWRVTVDDQSRQAPSVHDGTAYTGDITGTVYAVDAGDGTERWRASVPGFVAGVTATGAGVLVESYDEDRTRTLVSLDTEGEERWRESGKLRGVTVAAGTVYAGSENGKLLARPLAG
jgi:outer membrane protein assembly factor BamB